MCFNHGCNYCLCVRVIYVFEIPSKKKIHTSGSRNTYMECIFLTV